MHWLQDARRAHYCIPARPPRYEPNASIGRIQQLSKRPGIANICDPSSQVTLDQPTKSYILHGNANPPSTMNCS